MATILLEISRDNPVWCVSVLVSSSITLRLSSETVSYLAWGSLAANMLQGSSLPQFPSARHTGAHLVFSVAADIQTQVLVFVQQTLTR